MKQNSLVYVFFSSTHLKYAYNTNIEAIEPNLTHLFHQPEVDYMPYRPNNIF